MTDRFEPNQTDSSHSNTDSERDTPKRRRTYENRKHLDGSPKTTLSTSRYGRARKPKVAEDFCDIDEAFDGKPANPPPKSPKKTRKSAKMQMELEVTRTDDSDVLDISIPEDSEVSEVLKIVANKQEPVESAAHVSKPVKTYVNRKKISSPSYESFGLPDNLSQIFFNGTNTPKSSANDTDSNSIGEFEGESSQVASTAVKTKTNTEDEDKSERVSERVNRRSVKHNNKFTANKTTRTNLNKSVDKINVPDKVKQEMTSLSDSELNKPNSAKRTEDNKILNTKTKTLESDDHNVLSKPVKNAIKKLNSNKIVKNKSKKQLGELKNNCELPVDNPKQPNDMKPLVKVTESDLELVVGDLVWTRIGNHPYWPSIVTNEPGTECHTKTKSIGRGAKKMYHVHFFGDNGRRSWAFNTHMMHFRKRSDLQEMLFCLTSGAKPKDPKQLASFIVSSNKIKKWNNAVSEAESLQDNKREVRVDKFFKLYILKPSIKRERSPIENFSTDEKLKRKKLKLKNSLKSEVNYEMKSTEKERKIKEEDLDEKENNSNQKKSTKSNGNKESIVKKKTKIEDDSKGTQNKLSDSNAENTAELSDGAKINEDIKEEKEENVKLAENKIPEDTDFRKKLRLLDRKPFLNVSEDSLSETEKPVKSEVRESASPISIILPKQKRNILFRGITKERACQICGKLDKVRRCKGVCNGLFHIECDLKRAEKIIEAKNEEKNLVLQSEDQPEKINEPTDAMNDIFQLNEQCASIVGKIAEISSGEVEFLPNFNTPVDTKEKMNDEKSENNSEETIKSPETEKIKDFPAEFGAMRTAASKTERSLSLAEQIDLKMFEVMESLIIDTKYADSNSSDSSESEDVSENVVYSDDTSKHVVRHITADSVYEEVVAPKPAPDFKCHYCRNEVVPPCFVCNKVGLHGDTHRQRCTITQCGKFYHLKCLLTWPQTKWLNVQTKNKKHDKTHESVMCPLHSCHTCISDDPREPLSRCANEKLAKCIRCPSTYHISSYCIPAGSEILSTYQILCPKHCEPSNRIWKKINASWCFICAMGGSLICCDTCPASFHAECLKMSPPEGSFICEECESGRMPLYEEVVWVKLGNYRWWPAQILYPNEIPAKVTALAHYHGEFVVRFFGSHDYYWVDRSRVFLFQEGDSGQVSGKKSSVNGMFVKAIQEATHTHKLLQELKASRVAEKLQGLKPPPYIKIKSNRAYSNLRQADGNISNTTPCDCDPNSENPCGPDSDCLNRILMTECNPMVCAAGDQCNNQCFEKRSYIPVEPFKTSGRGWGLRCLVPVKKGTFIIEYIGELIDEKEYQRRIQRKHEQKDENYYFLTIDKDRMIDAGPKGNVARFMNHSCQPNCETQKWTVNGDTRVGLFAITDIPSHTELTFNYNLECVGKEKKICKCGAPNCSGYIGVKARQEENGKKRKFRNKKKIVEPISEKPIKVNICFVCSKSHAVLSCEKENCTKMYHLNCINLDELPDGKWLCPWHSCNICSKRTTRCCYVCINSYCPLHSKNKIRYDRVHGFICSEHEKKSSSNSNSNSSSMVSRSVSPVNRLTRDLSDDVNSNKDSEEAVQDKNIENKDDTSSSIGEQDSDTESLIKISKRAKMEPNITTKRITRHTEENIKLEEERKNLISKLVKNVKQSSKTGQKSEPEIDKIKKKSDENKYKNSPKHPKMSLRTSMRLKTRLSQDSSSESKKAAESTPNTDPVHSDSSDVPEYSHIISPSQSSKLDGSMQSLDDTLDGSLQSPNTSVNSEEAPKRKRGRPRKYFSATPVTSTTKRKIGRPRKHPKTVDNPDEMNRLYKSQISVELESSHDSVKEIKLATNIPERHLRTALRKNSEAENKMDNRFIQMQNDLEKDLPIRKRSKLRLETQL